MFKPERLFTGRRKLNENAKERGFTVIELVIVVMIIGILASIVIPNYMRFANKAKEAVVKENMHSLQVAVELYSVDHAATYPTAAGEADLKLLLPGGQFPTNPFTGVESPFVWEADPGQPGELAFLNLPGGGYSIKGYGIDGILQPPLTVGN